MIPEDKTKGEFLDPPRDFSFLRNEELQPKQCHLQNSVSVCSELIFLLGILRDQFFTFYIFLDRDVRPSL